jgi:hypothetical protein
MNHPGPRAAAVVAVLLLAAAPVRGQSPLVVQPEEFFAKTCGGGGIGVAAGSGKVYVCENGFWIRADMPPCTPDPPQGSCTGRPLCQSVANGQIYYCPAGEWVSVGAEIRGCDNCTEGPIGTVPDALVRFDGPTGTRLKSSGAVLTDAGDLTLTRPLGVASGGTGGANPAEARAGIGAANDAEVVHLDGDETIFGTKSFAGTTYFGAAYTFRQNGIRMSDLFPSVAAALDALPPSGGVLQLGPDEDDPVGFADINPAGPSTGKRDALALDLRRGGIRFLSSVPEYPAGPAGPLEERVPFVFQVRLDDPTRVTDQDTGAIGEWNCDVVPSFPQNCPSGNSSWGIPGGNKQYWHSGQCNTGDYPLSDFGSAGHCSGPHIFEIRYPERPGTVESKPIFAVGNGGAALYAPDNPSRYWRSYLTMFRGDDGGGEPAKANAPLFVFDRGGALLDGGTFCGNTLTFPHYSEHTYEPVNLWVQHDVALASPALVVEGTTDNSDLGETNPLARFYDRSGKGTFVHPGLAREAFGFYSHSRLYLGSYRDNIAAPERGQFIEWEGYTVDANTTRLRVEEPTASNDIVLPDTSGSVAVAPARDDMGPAYWGNPGLSGNEVCTAAGLACSQTIQFSGNNAQARPCDDLRTNIFVAFCTPQVPGASR